MSTTVRSSTSEFTKHMSVNVVMRMTLAEALRTPDILGVCLSSFVNLSLVFVFHEYFGILKYPIFHQLSFFFFFFFLPFNGY